MDKQYLFSFIQHYPLLNDEQKQILLNKAQCCDDDNKLINIYNLLQNQLNQYDNYLDKIYAVTIKYKDQLKSKWKDFVKNVFSFNEQKQKEEEELLKAEIMKKLKK